MYFGNQLYFIYVLNLGAKLPEDGLSDAITWRSDEIVFVHIKDAFIGVMNQQFNT
jgi:hypothetical protein